MTVPAGWRITERRGRDGLRALEEDWRRLYLRMPQRTSFISFEACSEYVERFLGDPDRVRCLVLDDGREARAIALLEPRVEGRLGFPVKTWGVLFMNRQCHRADIVGPEDEARRVFPPLLARHLRGCPDGRRLLVLGPLEQDATLWEGVAGLDPADLCREPTEPVRVLDCRRPFAVVAAGVSRSLRQTLGTARRRLAALAGVRFQMARGARGLAAELPVFLDLEASGWKGAGRSAIRHRPGLAEYYGALAGSLGGVQDQVEIHALYAGDRCLASALVTRTGATCSALKIAYDQAHGRCSPGHLLIAHLIEACCADPDIERVHFVSACPWLRGWPSELLDLQRVHVNIGGPAGRILVALLRFRLGPLRRLAAWAQPRLRRLGMWASEEPA